jgi:hypothetical protein
MGLQKAKNWEENEEIKFFQICIKEEKILPLTLAKVLKYNLEDIWFNWKVEKFEIGY